MRDLATLLHLRALALGTGRALLMIGVLFLVVWLLERRARSDISHYRSRHFGHDMAYALFYQSGVYGFLFASLIGSALETHLGIFRIDIFRGLPVALSALLYWLAADFFGYWLHRAEHRIPVLWQFHAVHHSNERITFLSSFRNHPIEQVIANSVMFVPLLLLGVAPHLWLPFYLFQQFFEAVQHAELEWRYGPLYRCIVSPVFHRLHHSTDREHHDQNFGKILSVWDHLFGTAHASRRPPATVGVAGLPSEPTLWGQFVGPFTRLATRVPPVTATAAPGNHAAPASRNS